MKHYLPRRMIALVLSVAMVLSMMCTAFATETGTTDTDPFDFSAEIAAQEAAESDTADEEDSTSDEAPSAESGTESDAAASEEDADAEVSAGNVSIAAAASESDVSVAAAASEDSAAAASEEAASDVTVASEDDTSGVAAVSEEAVAAVQVASSYVSANGTIYVAGKAYTGYYLSADGTMYSSSATDGYSLYSGLLTGGTEYFSAVDGICYSKSRIYKDGVLYTGYYMNAGGKMYTVKDGVYSLYTGTFSSSTKYYKDGSGTTTLSAGLVYLSGAVYTGYYMTTTGTMFYADKSGYSKYSGFVSGSSTYLAASDKKTHQCASRIYKDGSLYTGYYMNASGKMYTVSSGVYSLYTGTFSSSTKYYKDGSGTTTLSAGLVYLSGAVYTGYYMTTTGTMFYADKSGYSKYSGFVSGSSTYLAASDKKTHSCASRIYKDGSLYTGYYMNTGGKMYTVSSGVYSLYTGTLSSGTKYLTDGSGTLTLTVKQVYVSGKVYTGYYMSGGYMYYSNGTSGISLYSGISSTSYLSASDMKTYSCSSLVYVSGVLYTGYFMSSDNLMYTVTKGVYSLYTGTLSSGTKYYKLGTGYITLSEAVAYKSGVAQISGWKFSNNYAYYYVGGTKVTGWYYIKRNGATYKYYFDPSDGHLITNLYAYFGSSYKYKKCKLVINLTTHNASLLGYDESTDSYCIPFYSFIVSSAKKDGDTPTGTYSLSSNSHTKWFTFVDTDNNNKEYYYAYGTYISGSGAWFHSERYSTKGNLNTLVASTYNNLGTNQSSKCVRAQLYVAKLVYDIRDCYSGSIKVQIIRSSTYGAYGKITLSSTTGKISSSTKKDPTDSSSYKGYIKQTAE